MGREPLKPRVTIEHTREITANIHGLECDIIIIPKEPFVNVDYKRFPEDDPMRRESNIDVFTTVCLEQDDLTEDPLCGTQHLTREGAGKLLGSL